MNRKINSNEVALNSDEDRQKLWESVSAKAAKELFARDLPLSYAAKDEFCAWGYEAGKFGVARGRVVSLEGAKRWQARVRCKSASGAVLTEIKSLHAAGEAEPGGHEVFMPAKALSLVMDGDVCEFLLVPARSEGQWEAWAQKLISRDSPRLVARCSKDEAGMLRWHMEGRHPAIRLSVPDAPAALLQENNCIAVELTGLDRAALLRRPGATFSHIVASADDPKRESLIMAARWGTLVSAPLESAQSWDNTARADRRAVPFCTIDAETTKDRDDAIWAQDLGAGRFKVAIAISDVDAFIPKDSALDRLAAEFCTTLYLPHLSVPMIPREFSNGECSLNPHTDRLALIFDATLDASGQVEGEGLFSRGVIRSVAAVSYESARDFLEDAGGKTLGSPELDASMSAASGVARVLRDRARAEGRLDVESAGFRMELDPESGRASSLHSDARLWSHKLVEDLMLLANQQAAKFISKSFGGGVFRNHLGIREAGWGALQDLGEELGLGGAEMGTVASLSNLLNKAKGVSEGAYQQLRSEALTHMQSAFYGASNEGHFSLALPDYCHFTSPIRRYADLVVHRLIKAAIDKKPTPYSAQEQDELSRRIERRSKQSGMLENEARKLLLLDYLSEKPNLDAKVSAVSERGVWLDLSINQAAVPHYVSMQDWAAATEGGTPPLEELKPGDPLRISMGKPNLLARRAATVKIASFPRAFRPA